MLRTLILSTSLVALLVPVVEAQTGGTATVQNGALPGADVMVRGSSHTQRLDVTLRLNGIVCATATTFPVDVTATLMTNATLNATVIPARLSFLVPVGQYVTVAYTGTQTASIEVKGTDLPVGTARTMVHVTSRFPGATQCSAGAAIAPQEDKDQYNVVFDVPVPSGAVPPEGPQMPLPPFGFLVLALAAAALALRRRRGST